MFFPSAVACAKWNNLHFFKVTLLRFRIFQGIIFFIVMQLTYLIFEEKKLLHVFMSDKKLTSISLIGRFMALPIYYDVFAKTKERLN